MKVDIEFRVGDGERESVFDGVKCVTYGGSASEHISNLVIALAKIVDGVDVCDVAFLIVADGVMDINQIEKLRNDLDEMVKRHKENLAQLEKAVSEKSDC